MTKATLPAAAFALLLAGLTGCQTAAPQFEWERAEPATTPIAISLDRADFANEEHFRGTMPASEDFQSETFVTRLGDRSGSLPRLVVIHTFYTEPYSGLAEAFPIERTFRDENYGFFRDRAYSVGDARTIEVRGLPLNIANVATPGAECFAFAAIYGERSEGLLGDREVDGYFCRRGGVPIDDGEATEILTAIRTPGWD